MQLQALGILDLFSMGLLMVVLVVCGTTDLLYHKIFNKVTLPAIALGVAINLVAAIIQPQVGVHYLLSSLTGLAVGFVVFFVLFLFGGMGGGDVKFVAAIGAIDPFHFGYFFIIWVVFYSALAGGLIAIVAMTMKGRLLKSLKNVARTVWTFLAPGMEAEPLKKEDSLPIPFGLGIAFGTLWTVVLFLIKELP